MNRPIHLKKDRERKREVPSARQLRRSCNKELYRTAKRLNIWLPKEKFEEAEKYYFQQVVLKLPWIIENGNKRKLLCDWFETDVAPQIATIWEVDTKRLADAFRHAFGGN